MDNLLDIAPSSLSAALKDLAGPSYRVAQISDWIYRRQASSFDEMSNLPKGVRQLLEHRFRLESPEIEESTEPASDGSIKYLFRLADASLIEAVYMPMGSRTSVCLSSQAGCAVGCTFCVTGFFGAGRNLSPSEIIGQLAAIRRIHPIPWESLNVVFMGMGEPLLNVENLAAALEMLELSISPRRITVSTSGIIPGIEALAEASTRPNLAVSLNAPDQARREEIMPISKKYPIRALIGSLHRYPLEKGRLITLEYVLLKGWNDAPEDARLLARLTRGLHAKINVIPFNPDPKLPEWMKRPDDATIDRFAGALAAQQVNVTVRRSKGLEIAAACGQLRGRSERPRRA